MSEPSAIHTTRRFSRAALASLLLVNLIPLAGVVAFEWNLHTLIRVYWVENVVVGVATLAKIGLAKQVGPVGKTKLYKVLLFTAFYGTFWVIHGAILSRVVFATPPDGPFSIDILFVGAVMAFAISHGLAIKFAHWDAREHEKVTAFTQMLLPFVRVGPTHAVLILAALLVLRLDASLLLLVGVVVLKIALDLAFHLREHARIANR